MDKPWENEPDFLDWVDGEYGCRIIRHPVYKHLCGYVGVNKEHPLYKMNYSSITELCSNISVHWGLTFSDKFSSKDLPESDLWWIGFDCNHCNDFAPGYMDILNLSTVTSHYYAITYKTIDYVKQEVNNLIKQLRDSENTVSFLLGYTKGLISKMKEDVGNKELVVCKLVLKELDV